MAIYVGSSNKYKATINGVSCKVKAGKPVTNITTTTAKLGMAKLGTMKLGG